MIFLAPCAVVTGVFWDCTYDVLFEGEIGDCGSGSENIFAPGDGRESHDGVYPITLGILIEIAGLERYCMIEVGVMNESKVKLSQRVQPNLKQ